jgi:hypothetical protein
MLYIEKSMTIPATKYLKGLINAFMVDIIFHYASYLHYEKIYILIEY